MFKYYVSKFYLILDPPPPVKAGILNDNLNKIKSETVLSTTVGKLMKQKLGEGLTIQRGMAGGGT